MLPSPGRYQTASGDQKRSGTDWSTHRPHFWSKCPQPRIGDLIETEFEATPADLRSGSRFPFEIGQGRVDCLERCLFWLSGQGVRTDSWWAEKADWSFVWSVLASKMFDAVSKDGDIRMVGAPPKYGRVP